MLKRLGWSGLVFLWVVGGGLGSPNARAAAWGCYDPKPGHPTAGEKESFIEDVSRLAREAENDYGVPATALAAMAALESGYGWTRTAINANNLFGWKYVSDQAAGGRGFWVLECQPPEDVNNRYVAFADRADAVDFVAGRLASSDHYRADSMRYQEHRAAGVDVFEAANRWVNGIADPSTGSLRPTAAPFDAS